MIERLRHGRNQRGFTIIEVMVAMLVLLIGILGILKMLDTANAQAGVSQTRAQATALARQVIEAARGINYSSLTSSSGVENLLKSLPGLDDSNNADTAWTISRKSTTFTVSVFALCTVDDPLDHFGSHAAAASSFCPDSTTTGTEDVNPDDYKRITVQLAWKDPTGVARSTRQTALITNPGAGAGPGIYANFKMETPPCGTPPADQNTPPANCRIVDTNPETDQATFRVATKDPAANVQWSLENVAQGAATPSCAAGATTCSDFSFVWSLGCLSQNDQAAVCFDSNLNRIPTTLDGSYLIGAQATDETGNGGTPVYVSVSVNRRVPPAVPGFNVGWNGSIVEMEWLPDIDRDIQRYEVWRVDSSGNQDPAPGNGNDTLICDPGTPLGSSARGCTDTSATAGTSPQYWIVAYDNDNNGNLRPGVLSSVQTADPTNTAPNDPTNFSCSPCTGSAVNFTWTDNGDTNGGSIAFFRIYRRNSAGVPTVGDRYDRTTGPIPTSYTDSDTAVPHYYWITAVDNQLRESNPVPLQSGTAGG